MGNKCFGSGGNDNNKKKNWQAQLEEELNQIKVSTQNTCPVNFRDATDAHRLLRCNTHVDPVDSEAVKVLPEDYIYPFENMIFEGGGNKGLAYVGSIKCFEELGMMSQIKRLGGSSAGAITAALVALGYNSDDIFGFLSDNIEDIFLDHSCGYLSLLPNLLSRFGWNPGKKIYNWFGDRIKAKSKTGNPDMTFYELYKETGGAENGGKELCVVVTNLNQMRSEYCHLKTTPDMPIREALRMSMAIPGIFQARVYDNHGTHDTYVDGGVLCNYPIHCYDGWYLSLKKEDAFLLRLQSLSDLPRSWATRNRFEKHNPKTVGFLLYDDTEVEVMRYSLEKRLGANLPHKPDKETELYKQKEAEKEIQNKYEREHTRVVQAAEKFMMVLHKHNLSDQEIIDKEELKHALEDTETFTPEMRELLFGKNTDVDTIFNILDKDGNGRIAILELLQCMEERGIRMQTRIHGYGRIEVKNLMQFLSALQNSWTTNLKFVHVADRDEDRTVGINTGHVGTSDYELEEEDRSFIVQRGYNATKTFLQYFVVRRPQYVKMKDGSPVGNNETAATESGPLEVIGETNAEDIHLLQKT